MASVAQIIRRRRRRRLHRRGERTQRRLWIALVGLYVFLPFIVLGGIVLANIGATYMDALDLLQGDLKQGGYGNAGIGPTLIYDSSGRTLLFDVGDPLGAERTWVSLGELPEEIIQATLLWEEDPDFLESARFDPFQTLKALLQNLDHGPLNQDPSLTGRLVRNAVAPIPPPEAATVDDRALEIALVAEINRRYSPEEVLEWHLNTNDYGNGAYGIEAAAQIYLGKSARDLSLDEIALLVAIPTKPEINPVADETAARGRQAQMLRRLLAEGHITQSEFEQAIGTHTAIRPDAPLFAPEFAVYARRQAERILDFYELDGAQLVARGGLRIITTLDLDLYLQSECVLRTHLARLSGDMTPVAALDGSQCFGAVYLPAVDIVMSAYPPDTGVVVILDAPTNQILAMVGPGTQENYQPGVVLHPFVYLNGLLNGNYTLATMLLDVPRSFPGSADGLLYVPNNPDGQFRGPLSLRDAMGAGLLPPVVQVANVLNINEVLYDTVHPMGINALRNSVYDLSLLGRGGAVSVLDVTYAYSVFASMGYITGYPLPVGTYGARFRNHDPVAVKRIEDSHGNVLWDYNDEQIALSRVRVLDERVPYLINDVLADNAPKQFIFGANNLFGMSRRVAVIHGITVDHVDNWTIGYTPLIVTGVHLGRADNGALSLAGWGIEGSGPVWRAVMEYVHARDGLPVADWPRPAGIIEAPVCEISGMFPNDACRTRTEMFFSAAQIPPTDTYWQLVEINTQTNQLATASTPAALRSTRAYFIPPREALEWWLANDLPLPPTQHDTLSRPDIISDAVSILQPANLAIVGGRVEVSGGIDTENMAYYQLSYGQGPNPGQWIAITEPEESFVPGVPLGEWDTSTLDGPYTLQLTVAMNDGTLETAFSQVIVDNIPPSIVLQVGEMGRTYSWPDDQILPLVAEVVDNIRIVRVEFYHNGQYVGFDEDYPFSYEHRVERPGIEYFTAVVFDAVGNSSEAEVSIEIAPSSG